MLEEWEAKRLLALPKAYVGPPTVDLRPGSDRDYPLESDDGTEFFLLDVWMSPRNPDKARFQFRHSPHGAVLSRLCTAVPHTNPDGEYCEPPHLHVFHEEVIDKWAVHRSDIFDISYALQVFCDIIHLPVPAIEGGLT
ncbi:hypothetical protein LQ327_09405 [Actinomycetospora endophytica]|uniref:Uncharacterized protein n=1 Tax=Actinomycetospora endophytica TaxID=2291215 RepID=A0ABS8P5S9_9PSEU|nr:hypothetical protein [Actinomycetospora endophytica]MCD2193596.1 hypothetical protein [Actinomycetospora endophytica]